MPPGADLFVVCKQCGSEVSPYITECPYCGSRLRRRAPKLPRAHVPSRSTPRRGRLSALLARSPSSRSAPRGRSRGTRRAARASWDATRPYATIALVAVGALAWIVRHAEPQVFLKAAIVGPLNGDWWRLLSSPFAYLNGFYAFIALLVVAIFGWLLEQRHGPITVLALFFAASVSGALVALAVYPAPIVTGANAAGLAMLGAWAVPDLLALRDGDYYEGDLLGAGALGGLLLALPFAFPTPEVSWLSGVSGLAVGLLAGLGLQRTAAGGA
ncbi:MAG TPA: rhomboid family intramembrane serine protease [Solirubrobacteraceae bacterium]|jgi:membrane associated rhomboid family serine protease